MLKYLFPLCLVVLPCTGHASSLDSALRSCKQITEDIKRLACFDQIQLHSDTPTMAVSSAESAVPVKNQAVLTEEDFGLEHKAAVKDKLQSSVPMVLKKISTTPFGVQIFSFENAQVWRQVSKENFNAKIGKTYILERGALNSFFLSEEGSGRKTRVRRDK